MAWLANPWLPSYALAGPWPMAKMTRREFLARGASAGIAVSLLPGCELLSDRGVTTPKRAAEAGSIDPGVISRFRAGLKGHLVLPGDASYDRARRIFSWNSKTDKNPAMIVRCGSSTDVVRSVDFARSHELEIAVRGGGHDVQGSSVCEGGIVIDVSPMKRISIDLNRRVARVETGLTAGELSGACRVHGLAAALGCDAAVGISGLTLGGGVGWLAGKYGAACDNLLSVELVTANAETVVADANQNQELFWGMRGAGANFGIATAFEYQVHPVGRIFGGFIAYPISQAREFLLVYRELMANAPDELVVEFFSMAAFDRTRFRQPIVMAIACYCGDSDNGEKLLRPLRTFSRPIADSIRPMQYIALQRRPPLDFDRKLLGAKGIAKAALRSFDETPGYTYWRGAPIENLSDEAIAALIGQMQSAPPGWSVGVGHHIHGAISRVATTETAFIRRPGFSCFIEEDWRDPDQSEQAIGWVDKSSEAVQQFSASGTYVNFLSVAGDAAVESTYGTNYPRLAELKNTYDPQNIFHLNRNIRPASGRTGSLTNR